MGIQQSRVQLCTDQEYRRQNQKLVKNREQRAKRSAFYKIDSCQYPHPLMEQQYNHNQKQGNSSGSHHDHHQHRCTMKHAGYPDTYHLCSKCQQHPQKLQKPSKITYVQQGYSLPNPQPPKYNYKPTSYKQRDILAPGPQIPAFYNGFSLPVDRYYKQRTQFTDYSPQPAKGSPFREESRFFEQSIVEEVSDRKHSTHHEREINYDGYAQNLKF